MPDRPNDSKPDRPPSTLREQYPISFPDGAEDFYLSSTQLGQFEVLLRIAPEFTENQKKSLPPQQGERESLMISTSYTDSARTQTTSTTDESTTSQPLKPKTLADYGYTPPPYPDPSADCPPDDAPLPDPPRQTRDPKANGKAQTATATADAILPVNLDAERYVLGSIMRDNTNIERLGTLTADCFSLDSHRRTWLRMVDLREDAIPIDFVTLTDKLVESGEFEKVGGAAYLDSLVDGMPLNANVESWVRIVQNKAALRRMIYHHEVAKLRCMGRDADVPTIMDESSSFLEELKKDVGQFAGSVLNLANFPDPLELPHEDEPWLVQGILLEGGITEIAGAPGEGKTWQGLAIARALALGGDYLGRQSRIAEVVILDFENPRSIIQSRWQTMFGGPLKGKVTLWAPWSGMGEVPMLGDSRLMSLAQPGRVLIFDTLSGTHNAKDENASAEMNPVMKKFRALANRGASILLLHHRGKNDLSKYRGSSAIAAGVDIGCALTRDEGDLLTLDVWKTRGTCEFKVTFKADYTKGSFEVNELPATAARRDDIAAIAELIAEVPGISKNQIVQRLKINRNTAFELLRQHNGKLWRSEPGPRNSVRYFRLVSSTEYQ